MDKQTALGLLRLEDGRSWLEAAHNFQIEAMNATLDGDAPYNWDGRSRGCSKTTDLAGGATVDLASAESPLRLYWLAADRDQGALALDVIRGFLSRSPALRAVVSVQAGKVLGPAGAELRVLPADAPGTWGLLPDRVYVDEVANWASTDGARRLWEAVSTAAAKRSTCRMTVLTTASTPDHFAYTEILEPARRSSLWRVSERHGPSPWMSGERLEEQRSRLPDSVFRQLFLNEWTSAEGAFLSDDAVDAAFSLDGPTGADHVNFRYFAALDLGSVNDRTALAVGHRDGLCVLLDWLVTWKGSKVAPTRFEDIEETVCEAHQSYGFELSYDRWQALDLTQRLVSRGVHAREFVFTQPSKQRLAQTLLSTLNGGHLKLYPAEGLREELLGLRLVQAANGSWAFDHRPGAHDDMCVAVAMMATAALERGGPVGDSMPRWGGVPISAGIRTARF